LPEWAFFTPLSSGGLVAGRRLSPCPLFIASHGLSLLESRSSCQERSPVSLVTFVPNDERKYIHFQPFSAHFSLDSDWVIHRFP
jgi:hypothetical protein